MSIKVFQQLPQNTITSRTAERNNRSNSIDTFLQNTTTKIKQSSESESLVETRFQNESESLFSELNISNSVSYLNLSREALLAEKALLDKVQYLGERANNTDLTAYKKIKLQEQVDDLRNRFESFETIGINERNVLDGSFKDAAFSGLRLKNEPNNEVFYVLFAADNNSVANLLIPKVRKQKSSDADEQKNFSQFAISLPSGTINNLGNYAVISSSDVNTLANVSAAGSGKQSNLFSAQRLTLGGKVTKTTSLLSAGISAKDIIFQVNHFSSDTNITATATTTAILNDLSKDGTVEFKLYGDNEHIGTSISAQVKKDDLTNLATAINIVTDTTGVTATNETNALILRNTAGSDIAITNFQHSENTLESINFGTYSNRTRITTNEKNDSATVGGLIRFNSQYDFTITTDGGQSLLSKKKMLSLFESVTNVDLTQLAGAQSAEKIGSNGSTRVTELINGRNKTELTNESLNELKKQIQDLFGNNTGTPFTHFLSTQNKTSKSAANQLANIAREQVANDPSLSLNASSGFDPFGKKNLIDSLSLGNIVDLKV